MNMAVFARTESLDRGTSRWGWPLRRRSGDATPGPGDEVLDLIRQRAAAERKDPGTPAAPSFEPASTEAVEEAEKSLDFALPPFLKRVLLEIGNGGFGPGRGLLGVGGGATDEHGSSLVDLYDSLSADNPDDPGWRWPQHLVPICCWGDSTYSCVDCSLPGGQVVTFDADSYHPGADLARLLEPLDMTVEQWLRAWAEGVDLWCQMFPLE